MQQKNKMHHSRPWFNTGALYSRAMNGSA